MVPLASILFIQRIRRRYLEVEWEVRKGSQRSFGKEVMKGSSPRVPQQDNFSDCGVYVLQYVESFFEVSKQAGTLASCAIVVCHNVILSPAFFPCVAAMHLHTSIPFTIHLVHYVLL